MLKLFGYNNYNNIQGTSFVITEYAKVERRWECVIKSRSVSWKINKKHETNEMRGRHFWTELGNVQTAGRVAPDPLRKRDEDVLMVMKMAKSTPVLINGGSFCARNLFAGTSRILSGNSFHDFDSRFRLYASSMLLSHHCLYFRRLH